jgi:ribosomal protein S18 acetylase RimI-like enzyme
MINLNLHVRRATGEDHQQISNLMFYESNLHRHLDWRTPLDWLGSPNYWVLDEGNRISGVLACPEDPARVAWIRLFGYLSHLPASEAWYPLWDMVRTTVIEQAHTQVAAIVVKHWFQNLLLSSGFELKQNIVLLELRGENYRSFPVPRDIMIRAMQEEDLYAVAQLDQEAFGSFWHNSLDSLRRAYAQSNYASVAMDPSGLIGYQLSTGNPFGTHLARLGVGKKAQGRGVGTALVSELIQKLDPNRMARLSVNTQSDNLASLALYKKIGFTLTGEHYPVLVYPRRNP